MLYIFLIEPWRYNTKLSHCTYFTYILLQSRLLKKYSVSRLTKLLQVFSSHFLTVFVFTTCNVSERERVCFCCFVLKSNQTCLKYSLGFSLSLRKQRFFCLYSIKLLIINLQYYIRQTKTEIKKRNNTIGAILALNLTNCHLNISSF